MSGPMQPASAQPPSPEGAGPVGRKNKFFGVPPAGLLSADGFRRGMGGGGGPVGVPAVAGSFAGPDGLRAGVFFAFGGPLFVLLVFLHPPVFL